MLRFQLKRIFKRKKKKSFNEKDREKVLSQDTPFAIREAYNSIRTNLMFSGKGEDCPVFVVTSAQPNDGKSINCLNLAVSFAQAGKKVLLIDGDMRNPTVNRYLKKKSEGGLSEYLAGMSRSVEIRQTDVKDLYFITAGAIPPNPAELLAGERLAELLEELKKDYECIFIDTPPVEAVTDSSLLVPVATGFIFIVQAEKSDLTVLEHSVAVMEQLGAPIAGFILNKVNAKKQGYYKRYSRYNSYYYKYGSRYGYGKRDGAYGYGYGYGKPAERGTDSASDH